MMAAQKCEQDVRNAVTTIRFTDYFRRRLQKTLIFTQ